MVDIAPYHAILFPIPISKPKLEEIKSCLLTFLYIIFEKPKPNNLGEKFCKIVNENDKNDNIITFNYDLVLEKLLWKRNIWSPLNGYAGVNKFRNTNDKKKLEEANKCYKLQIHKMHGSICWDTESFSRSDTSRDIFIKLDNIEKWDFHFEGLKEILNRDPIKPSSQDEAQNSQGYAGKHNPPWILPSFIKPFERKEFYEIWQSAIDVLSKTDELVIIGYSFRPEDSNSFLLLSMLPRECNIRIVDPRADEVKKNLESKGFKNIFASFASLKNYLEWDSNRFEIPSNS